MILITESRMLESQNFLPSLIVMERIIFARQLKEEDPEAVEVVFDNGESCTIKCNFETLARIMEELKL